MIATIEPRSTTVIWYYGRQDARDCFTVESCDETKKEFLDKNIA